MTRAYGPTLDFNRLMREQLPPEDGQDRLDAEQGFIGTVEHAEVLSADGRVVWSQRPYAFLDDEEPADTVNPSLWRHARLNRAHGLFQVSPRIFQVRGFDIANITFIEGDTGLIALDALTVADTAAAALALYRKHRDPEGRRVLHTVMYSHSHGDHFGGVLGLDIVQMVDPSQQLDILTMLGFVILVGTVVNNSILIVHQGLNFMREGWDQRAAIKESVRVRVRPIFMTTGTTVLGMMPLIIMPGAGSELYRGIGAVVVGGLAVSTLVTLVLTPLVFSYAIELVVKVRSLLGLSERAVGAVPSLEGE